MLAGARCHFADTPPARPRPCRSAPANRPDRNGWVRYVAAMAATDSTPAEIRAAHYFAGIVGTSIVRRWYEDGAFNEVRLQELADVIAGRHEFPHSLVLQPQEHDLLDGYARWAETYDGPNPLIAAEEPHVHTLLAPLVGPGVLALDAACGTGRHAAHLAANGCDVVGVDQSAEMLDVARSKLPAATFHQASLEALPFDSGTFDVATCALALCHLPDPTAAVVEIGRVLRPGGTLVITDPPPERRAAGRAGLLRRHRAGRADAVRAQPRPPGLHLAAGVPRCRPRRGRLPRTAVHRGSGRVVARRAHLPRRHRRRSRRPARHVGVAPRTPLTRVKPRAAPRTRPSVASCSTRATDRDHGGTHAVR